MIYESGGNLERETGGADGAASPARPDASHSGDATPASDAAAPPFCENAPTCPAGWLNGPDESCSCYLFATKITDKIGFHGAREQCGVAAEGADLAIVETTGENDWLKGSYEGDLWIGLHAPQGSWQWVNGDELGGFHDFGDGASPQTPPPWQSCVQSGPSSWLINYEGCDDEERYVCEIEVLP